MCLVNKIFKFFFKITFQSAPITKQCIRNNLPAKQKSKVCKLDLSVAVVSLVAVVFVVIDAVAVVVFCSFCFFFTLLLNFHKISKQSEKNYEIIFSYYYCCFVIVQKLRKRKGEKIRQKRKIKSVVWLNRNSHTTSGESWGGGVVDLMLVASLTWLVCGFFYGKAIMVEEVEKEEHGAVVCIFFFIFFKTKHILQFLYFLYKQKETKKKPAVFVDCTLHFI